MAKVFNLGIGMIVVVAPDDAHRALDVLRTNGHRAVEIGEVRRGEGRVELHLTSTEIGALERHARSTRQERWVVTRSSRCGTSGGDRRRGSASSAGAAGPAGRPRW